MPSDRSVQAAAGARRTLLTAFGVAVFMGAMSFAAVPFYNWFCRVTGFAGTTQVADAAPGGVEGETINVLFDASTHRDMPWEFEPAQASMEVTVGASSLAFYKAHNPTDRTITGTATYNVAPLDLGGYFSKVACFCFQEQTLAPGETVMMPVSFFVDPDLLQDEEHQGLRTITLSYTFFLVDEAQDTETQTSALVQPR